MNGILSAIVLKASFVPAALKTFRAANDPHYSSPHCLLRLVNETNPEHYELHPVWKDFVYDSSCAGDEQLAAYVSAQYSDPREQRIFALIMGLSVFVGLAMLAYKLGRAAVDRTITKRSVVLTFFSWVVAYQSSRVQMMYAHFEQDITFMLGNMMHHSDVSRFTDGPNGIGVSKTFPQGLLLSYVSNFLVWNLYVNMYSVVRMDPALRRAFNPKTLAALAALSLAKIFYELSYEHLICHETSVPEDANAWPYTFRHKAYTHVFKHHVNGDSMGNSPHWDPFFSVALYLYGFLHNAVLGLQIDTPPHYAFAVVFDVVMGAVLTVAFWGCFRLALKLTDALTGTTAPEPVAREKKD